MDQETLFNFPGEKKDIKYKYPDEEVSVILSDGHEPEISVEAIIIIRVPFRS